MKGVRAMAEKEVDSAEMNNTRHKWRTVPWLAETLSVSRSHAYKLIDDGCFVAACFGRRGSWRGVRVREDSVYAYLERKALARSLADLGAESENPKMAAIVSL